jgi:hypothetical protein
MKNDPENTLTEAERLDAQNLLVTFGDGKVAVYSGSLLRDALPQAKEIKTDDEAHLPIPETGSSE